MSSVSAACVLSFKVEVKEENIFMFLALTYRTDYPLVYIYVMTELQI